MEIELIVNDNYFKNLQEFLKYNFRDSGGLDWEYMSERDKSEVINQLKESAFNDYQDYKGQILRGKYCQSYKDVIFSLCDSYFDIIVKDYSSDSEYRTNLNNFMLAILRFKCK